MADPLGMLQAALDATIARFAPESDRSRAALVALAGEFRHMTRGPVDEEPHERARTWDDLPWVYFRDGIDTVALSCPQGGVAAAALLRYRAGASIPDHLHTGDEHIIVLSGSQRDERGTYVRGATIFNAAGSTHNVFSPEGCVVGVFWEKPVRFLAGGQN